MGLLSGLGSASGEKLSLLPVAEYAVNIAAVEMVLSKEKNLPMWKIKFRITGGDNDGRPVFDQVVLPNGSQDNFQREMSLNRIKRLCIAAGVDTSDEDDNRIREELVGKSMRIIVGIRKNKTTGQDANNVEDYLSAS